MMGQMTYGKRQFESLDSTVRELLPITYQNMIQAIPMIDADTDAFNDYMVFHFPPSTSIDVLLWLRDLSVANRCISLCCRQHFTQLH